MEAMSGRGGTSKRGLVGTSSHISCESLALLDAIILFRQDRLTRVSGLIAPRIPSSPAFSMSRYVTSRPIDLDARDRYLAVPPYCLDQHSMTISHTPTHDVIHCQDVAATALDPVRAARATLLSCQGDPRAHRRRRRRARCEDKSITA